MIKFYESETFIMGCQTYKASGIPCSGKLLYVLMKTTNLVDPGPVQQND